MRKDFFLTIAAIISVFSMTEIFETYLQMDKGANLSSKVKPIEVFRAYHPANDPSCTLEISMEGNEVQGTLTAPANVEGVQININLNYAHVWYCKDVNNIFIEEQK